MKIVPARSIPVARSIGAIISEMKRSLVSQDPQFPTDDNGDGGGFANPGEDIRHDVAPLPGELGSMRGSGRHDGAGRFPAALEAALAGHPPSSGTPRTPQ